MPDPIIVDYPLSAAAAWIGGGGRRYSNLTTENQLATNQWAQAGLACGITCTLAGNVRIQMRYDYDQINGFHVDAYKLNHGEHRIYAMQGGNKGQALGPGNVAIREYTTALQWMNNRYENKFGEDEMARAFLLGQK